MHACVIVVAVFNFKLVFPQGNVKKRPANYGESKNYILTHCIQTSIGDAFQGSKG
jgi:hypothetical protein